MVYAEELQGSENTAAFLNKVQQADGGIVAVTEWEDWYTVFYTAPEPVQADTPESAAPVAENEPADCGCGGNWKCCGG